MSIICHRAVKQRMGPCVSLVRFSFSKGINITTTTKALRSFAWEPLEATTAALDHRLRLRFFSVGSVVIISLASLYQEQALLGVKHMHSVHLDLSMSLCFVEEIVYFQGPQQAYNVGFTCKESHKRENWKPNRIVITDWVIQSGSSGSFFVSRSRSRNCLWIQFSSPRDIPLIFGIIQRQFLWNES